MRTRTLSPAVLCLAVLLTAPHPSAAWGFEAHRYIMARAIALPPEAVTRYGEAFVTRRGLLPPGQGLVGRLHGR